jgi:hypothetical protein
MVRKLKSGEYRLYSRKKNTKTGKRRNLGTFKTRQAARSACASRAVFQTALASATIGSLLSTSRSRTAELAKLFASVLYSRLT